MKKKLKREKEENEKLTKKADEQTFLTAADADNDKSQEQTIKSLLGELAIAKNELNQQESQKQNIES